MDNTFIAALEDTFNYKLTENMGVALKSTGSKVYDFFAFGAAYRNRTDEDCVLLFKNAYEEDAELALKALFYIRDCRGGQGERRFFRVCFHWLAQEYPEVAEKFLDYIPNYGRYDDWFILFDTVLKDTICNKIKRQLTLDMMGCYDNVAISLLAKWMPSENAHNRENKKLAKIIREYIGLTSKQYRQMLSKLRAHLNVLETLMSSNRWDEIEFDKIPSKAGLVYRNAFARRDLIAEKYMEFMKDKNTSVNADTLYPYEIVEKITKKISWDGSFNGTDVERAALNKYWKNQKDYLNGASPSMLCVIDTSGSMQGRPINVACSLGLYCAERMTGDFAGKYISFASCPQLINCEGVDFVDKVGRIFATNLVDNTDLTAVFDLLYNMVVYKGANPNDLPKTICVISDMEIDYMSHWTEGTVETEMDKVRKKWAEVGLKLPKLVYWNVDARHNTILDKGSDVSFVSGCSPVIFEQILTGKTGIELMLKILLSDRYKDISLK